MAIVYALHDPSDDRAPVYIGVTTTTLARRLSAHRHKGRTGVMTALESVDDEERWDAEEFWITSLRGLGMNLSNKSNGRGLSGYSPPREVYERRSKKTRGRKPSAEVVERRAAGNRGRTHAPPPPVSNASGYRGVRAQDGSFESWIQNRYLGRHATAEAAARAYDSEARRIYGGRGRFNFPLRGERDARKAD